jgi:hypothetical protein
MPTWAASSTRSAWLVRAAARAADTAPSCQHGSAIATYSCMGLPSTRRPTSQGEKKALQFAGKVFLDLSPADLTKALHAGVLVEVHCVEQAH